MSGSKISSSNPRDLYDASTTTTTTTSSGTSRKPQAIKPDDFRFTLEEFQKLASGKYNAGNIVLTSKGKLDIANNHRHWTILNTKKISPEDAFAVRAAFIDALTSRAGLPPDKLARVCERLGINEDLAARNERAFTPLTRQEVREIIDANIADINAGHAYPTLRTGDEIHANTSQSTLQERARIRNELNAVSAGQIDRDATSDFSRTMDVLFKADYRTCGTSELRDMLDFARKLQGMVGILQPDADEEEVATQAGRGSHRAISYFDRTRSDSDALAVDPKTSHVVYVLNAGGKRREIHLGDPKELADKLEACMRRMNTVLAGGQGSGVVDSRSSAEDEQSAPVEQPVGPAAAPVAPAAAPVAPPEEPVAPPEDPVVHAEVPVAHTEQPVVASGQPVAPAEQPVAPAVQPVEYKMGIEVTWMKGILDPNKDFANCPFQELEKMGEFLHDLQPKLSQLLNHQFGSAQEDFEYGHLIPLDGFANHAVAIDNSTGQAGLVVSEGGAREFVPLGDAASLEARIATAAGRIDEVAARILDQQMAKPVITSQEQFRTFIQDLHTHPLTTQFGGETPKVDSANDGYGVQRNIFTYKGLVFRCADEDPEEVFAHGFTSENPLSDPNNLRAAMGLGVPWQDPQGNHGYQDLGATGRNGVSTAKTIGQAIHYLQPSNAARGIRRIYVIDTTKLPGSESAWDLDANFHGNDFHRLSPTVPNGEVNISSIPPNAIVGCVVPGNNEIQKSVDKGEFEEAVGMLGGYDIRFNTGYAA